MFCSKLLVLVIVVLWNLSVSFHLLALKNAIPDTLQARSGHFVHRFGPHRSVVKATELFYSNPTRSSKVAEGAKNHCVVAVGTGVGERQDTKLLLVE